MECQAIPWCLAFLCLAVRRDESGSLMMTHTPLQLHKAARCIQRIFKGRFSRDLTRKLKGMRNQYELLNRCPACGSRYADHPVAWLMKPVKDGGQAGSGAVYSEESGLWKELTACCGVCRALVCSKRADHWWKSGKVIPHMLPVMMGNVLRYQVAENDERVEVDSSLWETRPKPDAVRWLLAASQMKLKANGQLGGAGEEEVEEDVHEEEWEDLLESVQDGEGDVRAAVSPRSPLQPLTSIEENILTDSDEDFAGSDVEEELGATFQKLRLRLIMPEEREKEKSRQEFLLSQSWPVDSS
jgi:hypothetical protein